MTPSARTVEVPVCLNYIFGIDDPVARPFHESDARYPAVVRGMRLLDAPVARKTRGRFVQKGSGPPRSAGARSDTVEVPRAVQRVARSGLLLTR